MPTRLAMIPIITIGFSLRFFLANQIIARIIPARPVNTLTALTNMIQAKVSVNMPNTNEVIAIPVDDLTDTGVDPIG